MISTNHIAAWAASHPWPTQQQVEQDLLLSRAICAIADDPYLGEELTFRGGTAFHKLHVDTPYRYSEDLDYVRSSAGGIAQLTRTLTELGASLDFSVKTKISKYPKVYWRTTAANGVPIRIKIEVNTHERSPALSPVRIHHAVVSDWWSGKSAVKTFDVAELVATKIRALYQRSKGRDLFDLWLALTSVGVEADKILAAFEPYRPEGLTAKLAVANLREKVADGTFRADLGPLVTAMPTAYSIESAAETVIDQLLDHLDA
ncbi:nucleotidyl transferase AbiEii/AbiGii toxin family protein [Myceligenerans crystallogenes]|uniref:Nucleotidyl transferase AbiEii/AbiGii toxin family protein n=1 Tax=Myceligenerans crystallogenes TaxID=316335 RepID=A0ABP4ZZI0_9MICO